MYFGQFFLKNGKSSQRLMRTLFPRKNNVQLLTKKPGWATFWATFSETHLVTLKAAFKETFANFYPCRFDCVSFFP
jgi:hypothetical protein